MGAVFNNIINVLLCGEDVPIPLCLYDAKLIFLLKLYKSLSVIL